MKVLLLNGSPRKSGNTATALKEMISVFESEGIDTELIEVGSADVSSCKACRTCHSTGRCIVDDIVNEVLPKFDFCDGIVIGSPVYYSMASGALTNFLQRLFYSSVKIDKRMKVGAAVVCARRAGTTATFEQLNQFFTISEMPVVSGSYWNNVHGAAEGECLGDEEGLQNVRTVARNMVFLMRAIADAKDKYGLPAKEEIRKTTNFIR